MFKIFYNIRLKKFEKEKYQNSFFEKKPNWEDLQESEYIKGTVIKTVTTVQQ